MPILNYTLPMQIVNGVDTSNDTVTPESMLEGTIALDATGAQITGTIATYDGIVSGGLSVVEQVAKYLYGVERITYNEVTMPKLPEWDKEAYPYAYICTAFGATFLHITSTKTQYEISGNYKSDTHIDDFNYLGYIYQNGAWIEYGSGSKNAGQSLSDTDDLDIIWSNHDVIKYGTDEIYLAASEPVYIDLLLPDINEVYTLDLAPVDMSKYPYRIIVDAGSIVCFAFSKPLYVGENGSLTYSHEGAFDYLYVVFATKEMAESEGIEISSDAWLVVDEGIDVEAFGYPATAFRWTSHDILNEDGSVYLKATEPVPVYE